MSDEVICLSSDLSSDEDRSVPLKSSKIAAQEETNVLKRKSNYVSFNGNEKKPKFEHKECNSPQPGCSKNVNEIKNKIIPTKLVAKTKIPLPSENEDVFQNFIKTCLERRDDEDTKKVLQKLQKLYNKLSPVQQKNDEFRLYINSCREKIIQGLSADIYTPILDVHSEIKQRIERKSVDQIRNNSVDNDNEIEVSKADMKRIILLENSIKQCLNKIKELEEKPVDFDEDKNSAYIQEDKYKKRLIQLCNALSKINGDKLLRKQILKKKIRIKDIPNEITGIPLIDEAIVSFVNSDIGKINKLKYLETQSCADHIQMPTYLDILKCIKKCNAGSNLNLNEEEMARLAKKAFQAVGYYLQKKRIEETKYYMQSFLHDGTEDPAIKDVQLNRKLQINKKEGDKKLEEIFKKYIEKQDEMKNKDNSSESYSESETEDEDLDKSSSTVTDDNEVYAKNTKSESSKIEENLMDENRPKIVRNNQLLMKDETNKNSITIKTNSSSENNFSITIRNNKKINTEDDNTKQLNLRVGNPDEVSKITIAQNSNSIGEYNKCIGNNDEIINNRGNENCNGNSNKKEGSQRLLEGELVNLKFSKKAVNSETRKDKLHKEEKELLEDNTVQKIEFKSSISKNKIINQQCTNILKAAPSVMDEDDDVLVIVDDDE